MFSPLASQRILYASAGLSAIAVYKHTLIGINELFSKLERGNLDSTAVWAAKSNFLQVGAAWCVIGILQLKWAAYGVADGYDKAILGFYVAYSFLFGLGFFRRGVYVPLIPLWIIPAVTVASQL
ncbi:hypothetical protein VTL71DRAFT_10165 [Oculimacula yallundae]|uniref:Uncharacterized protein n=1 Tax=Oculimacula yallundae TaxID=86028 RepID=A0ABR4BR97_9HELO